MSEHDEHHEPGSVHPHEQEHGPSHGHTHGDAAEEQPTTGLHGMLLFGDDVLYLSHLPMFASPHNFQVILEVAFDETVGERLRSDRAEHDDGIYTFEPELFPIVELDPEGGGPVRSSIEGTIYRGHFERGGQPIARAAVAQLLGVVHFEELDVAAEHDPDRDLAYLCFGRGSQLHLAHRITACPDFDQVLTVALVPGTVTDPAGRPVGEGEDVVRDFDQAEPVQFRARRDTPGERLGPDETAVGFFFATFGPTGSHGFAVEIKTGQEIYVEVRELACP